MSDDQDYGPPEMRALIRAAAEHSVLSLPEALERLHAAESERDRLQAAIKAHHFDVAHTASSGIGVRASDHALYREAGLPDVGEADMETGAEFIARMERISAERDQLQTEVLAHTKTARERDRLRAVVKYLRAAAHLFPHVNTDRATTTELGLPDDGDVWCLGCTIGATVDDTFPEFMRNLAADGDSGDERARRWMTEFEQLDGPPPPYDDINEGTPWDGEATT